jgi:hypothetical protein
MSNSTFKLLSACRRRRLLFPPAEGIPDHCQASQLRPKRPRISLFEPAPPIGMNLVTENNLQK